MEVLLRIHVGYIHQEEEQQPRKRKNEKIGWIDGWMD